MINNLNLSVKLIPILKLSLKMKLTFILVFLSLLNIEANTYSQNTKFTLDLENTTVENVFTEIKNNSEFKILYATGEIDLQRLVSINVKRQGVDVILKQLFSSTPIAYKIVDKQIVLSIQKESAIPSTSRKVSKVKIEKKVQNMVSGTVKDAIGTPLPDVNIAISGTAKGTKTDFDGNYSLEANKGDVLIFSFIGMDTKSITVGDTNTIDVVLVENQASLDEVVVIGYGTQRKKAIAGAVESVNSDDFKNQPMTNAVDALQGRATGVFVGSTNGAPGGNSKIVIRGQNSIGNGNGPLVVIDGIVGGSLENLNPSEIASMQVLKDASSTAIFGSRGANGVIIVTTKNGTTEGAQVSFETFYGMQSVSKKIDLLSAADFAKQVNIKGFDISGAAPTYTDQEIADLASSGGTDWQDELFRSAPTKNYNLSVSGKSGKIDYYFSGGLADQEGIILNTGFKRYNFRTKVNAQVSDKIRIGMNLSTMRSKGLNNQNRSTLTSPVYGALAYDPTMPIYDAEGFYNLTSIKGVGTLGVNPLALQLEQNMDINKKNLLLSAYLNYEIIDGLTLNVTGGSNVNTNKTEMFNAELTSKNFAGIYDNEVTTNQLTSRLTYEKEIGEDHKLKLDAIYEFSATDGFLDGISASNVSNANLNINNIGDAESVNANSKAFERQLESVMGRIHYSFQDKYIITAAIRRDGASVLADGLKYKTYPSVGVAWNMAKDLFDESTVVDDMKFRVSYGTTGSQVVGPYQTFALNGTGPEHRYPFDDATGVPGVGPAVLANPNLGWESTTQLNFGLDMTFLNNRLGLVLDWYKKGTDNIIMGVPIAPYRGPVSLTANMAGTENTGIELGINGTIINTDNFRWDANFNFAKNESIVTDLGGVKSALAGGKYGAGLAIAPAILLEVGEKTGNFYGYLYDGVWKSSEATGAAVYGNVPGDAKYKDINSDGKINNDDLTVMGNGQHDFVWGINNTLTYNAFDLNVFFQGVNGNDIWNLGRGYIIGGSADARHATSPDILNRWTPQNENTDIPAYSATSKDYIQSSRYVEDGSYVKLRNVSLGYNLPEAIANKSKLFSSLRIYVSGQNLLTFTNYSGFDPEITSTGNNPVAQSIDFGAYPTAKSFIFGINVTF